MKRWCLEVLKFTSAEDILLHASVTCRLWYQVSNENELWHELLAQESLADLGPKETFRLSRQLVLAKLDHSNLVLYRCAIGTQETVPLKGTCKVSWNSAHAFVDQLRVLTCGSQIGGFSPESFLINIRTGDCTQVESMTMPRVGHGLIVVKAAAYVFGGYGPMKSCETWQEGKPWRLFSQEMRSGRAWFTPCAEKDVIYLCGGGQGPCEQFDINSESLEDLSITLPGDYVSAFSYSHKNCLLIVTNSHFAVYDLLSRQSYITDHKVGKDAWSNSPVVLYKNTLIMERDEEENREVALTRLLQSSVFAHLLS